MADGSMFARLQSAGAGGSGLDAVTSAVKVAGEVMLACPTIESAWNKFSSSTTGNDQEDGASDNEDEVDPKDGSVGTELNLAN